MAILFAGLCWPVYKLSEGRNWARIFYVVTAVGGIMLNLLAVESQSLSPLTVMFSLVMIPVEFWIVWSNSVKTIG